jgi:hypothetical protein
VLSAFAYIVILIILTYCVGIIEEPETPLIEDPIAISIFFIFIIAGAVCGSLTQAKPNHQWLYKKINIDSTSEGNGDDDYIKAVFDIDVGDKKDPGHRATCGCVVSKDIGMYDSCLFGCQYCYATSSFERAKNNYDSHDPDSPSLIGRHEV